MPSLPRKVALVGPIKELFQKAFASSKYKGKSATEQLSSAIVRSINLFILLKILAWNCCCCQTCNESLPSPPFFETTFYSISLYFTTLYPLFLSHCFISLLPNFNGLYISLFLIVFPLLFFRWVSALHIMGGLLGCNCFLSQDSLTVLIAPQEWKSRTDQCFCSSDI